MTTALIWNGLRALMRGKDNNETAPDFAALVGHAGWRRLDPDIRRRFSAGHAAAPVTYPGRMAVWRSCIGALFAAAAQLLGGPLPVRKEKDVPTEVRVYRAECGGIVWERWLRFAGSRATCVRSTKRCGPGGSLLECVDGGLGMTLAVFEQDRSLVFQSRSYFLHCAGMRIPIPSLLTPGRCTVTHAPVSRRRFRFTMTMAHPLWGRTFHQDGEFDDPQEVA